MKKIYFLFALFLLTHSTMSFACKMLAEDWKKHSQEVVKSFINERHPNAVIQSTEILSNGRIRVSSQDSIPKLYRVLIASDCKTTVNIVRRKR